MGTVLLDASALLGQRSVQSAALIVDLHDTLPSLLLRLSETTLAFGACLVGLGNFRAELFDLPRGSGTGLLQLHD